MRVTVSSTGRLNVSSVTGRLIECGGLWVVIMAGSLCTTEKMAWIIRHSSYVRLPTLAWFCQVAAMNADWQSVWFAVVTFACAFPVSALIRSRSR